MTVPAKCEVSSLYTVRVRSQSDTMVSFQELSLWSAVAACLGLALIFVLSLYAVDVGLPRSHPRTVRRRVAVIACVCAVGPLYVWLWSDVATKTGSLWNVLGLKWAGLLPAAATGIVLVVVLYLGPIVQTMTSSTGESLFGHMRAERLDICLRNYLIAPFAEEFIFRACMVPLLLPHLGMTATVLLCPLFFGLAHMHHLVEWYWRGEGTLIQACLQVLVQVCYTSIFGSFSAFLFIRTGHLVSAVLSHSLCNMLGLPPVGDVSSHRYRSVVMATYLAGLLGFIALLFPITSPHRFLIAPLAPAV